jgi:hypothetical protein
MIRKKPHAHQDATVGDDDRWRAVVFRRDISHCVLHLG